MTDNDILKEIEKVTKKFKLPDLNELDSEFDISNIETPTNSLLKTIRNKMIEKIDSFAKFLEDYLYHPDSSYACMCEIQDFSETDRKKLFALYRKLMLLERTNINLNLVLDEKKDAEFINHTFKQWQELKKELLKFSEKIKRVWEIDPKKAETVNYFT